MADAVVLGECMVELGLEDGRRAALGYAGDTFNTAIYLARLGVSTDYATAIGAGDPFSAGIRQLMDAEGVGRRLVVEAPGRLPGLYAIARDARGERNFFYWRENSPAREYVDLVDLKRLADALARARLAYLSAISLAIVGSGGRRRLRPLLRRAGQAGAAVALDTNYRARLWPDAGAARAAVEDVASLCRYISCSVEDVAALGAHPDEAAARWAAAGAEVVLRRADHAVEVWTGAVREGFAPGPDVAVVDTTGAGDSFNAGYLAARLAGRPAAEAVAAGRRLAAAVVQHSGAIIPREAMPAV